MCDSRLDPRAKRGKWKRRIFLLFFFFKKYSLQYFRVSEHVWNYFQMIRGKNKTYTYIERYISTLNISEEQRDDGKVKMT